LAGAKVVPKNNQSERISEMFYHRSEEKFVVRQLLDEIWKERRFAHALDIGPGRGRVTEPLASRSDQLTMVEVNPSCEGPLREQFPGATIIIDSIENVSFEREFDVILLSHNLYFHPADGWLELCRRLFNWLVPGGELVIIMNTDNGDWWRIMTRYWEPLREHIKFEYVRMSLFDQELAQVCPPKVYPYRYQVWVEPGASFGEFIRIMLEVTDPAVYKAHEQEFRALEQEFRHVDGSVVLDYHGEVIRLVKD
jgi:SAM-dependent methyltransferase